MARREARAHLAKGGSARSHPGTDGSARPAPPGVTGGVFSARHPPRFGETEKERERERETGRPKRPSQARGRFHLFSPSRFFLNFSVVVPAEPGTHNHQPLPNGHSPIDKSERMGPSLRGDDSKEITAKRSRLPFTPVPDFAGSPHHRRMVNDPFSSPPPIGIEFVTDPC